MNGEIFQFFILFLLLLIINHLLNKDYLSDDVNLLSVNETGDLQLENTTDIYSYIDNKVQEIDTSRPEIIMSDVDEKIIENNNIVKSTIDTTIQVPESRYLLQTEYNTFKNPGGYLDDFIKKGSPYSLTVTQPVEGEPKYTLDDNLTEETPEQRVLRLGLEREQEEELAQAAALSLVNAVANQIKQNYKTYLTKKLKYENPFGMVEDNRHILNNEIQVTMEKASKEFNKLSDTEKNKYRSSVPDQYNAESTNKRRQKAYIWYLYTMAKIVNPNRGYVDFYNNNDNIKHIKNNWNGAGKTTYKLIGSQSDMTEEGKGRQIEKKDVEDYIGTLSNELKATTRFYNYKNFKNEKIKIQWEVIGITRPQSRGGPTVSNGEIFDTFSRYMTIQQHMSYENKTPASFTLSIEQKRKVRHMLDKFIEFRREDEKYNKTFNEFVTPATGDYYSKKIKDGKTAHELWANSSANAPWKRRYDDGTGERKDPWDYWSKQSLKEILKFEYSDDWLNKLNSSHRAAKIKIIEETDTNYTTVNGDDALKQFLALNKIPVLSHANYIGVRNGLANTWVKNLIIDKTFARGRNHYNAYNHTRARYRNYGETANINSTNTWLKVRAQRIEQEKAIENTKYSSFGYSEFYPWLTSDSMKYEERIDDKEHREETRKEDERWEILWGRIWKPHFEQNCGRSYKDRKKPSILQLYLDWDFNAKKYIDDITYNNKTKLWSSQYRNKSWVMQLKNKSIIPNVRFYPRSSCPTTGSQTIALPSGQTFNLANLANFRFR